MLKSLGEKFGTDKVSHGFIPFYENIMNKDKNEPISFLEIGVFYGASIRMWAEYFTHDESKIYGADWFKGLNGNKHTFPHADYILHQELDPRITLIELNQGSLEELEQFSKRNLTFNYILDDGSHLMKDQQQTFLSLFPMVKSGGYYILEDLHTSFDLDGYDVEENVVTAYEMVDSLKNGKVPILKYGVLPSDILSQIKDIQIFKTDRGSITCYINKH